MMRWKSVGLMAGMLVLGAAPLQAQAAVIRPDRELTPAESGLRATIYQLRDSLAMVSGAGARMERDFRTTSDAALISRARELARRCEAASRNVPATTAAVKGAEMQTGLQRDQQVRLLGGLTQLSEALAECSKRFGAMAAGSKGQEIRDYGNARLRPVKAELFRYESAVAGFFKALQIPNPPLGSHPNPIIG